MIRHTKIFNEFKNFLIELEVNTFSDYEKKFINLIIDNFDDIVSVSTRQGKRAKLINRLIVEKGKILKTELIIPIHSFEKSTFPFHYLTSLELQNFRGFTSPENIEFSKKYTFIYGPNGSGKSSLCEALEYSMLGFINEANLKRIPIEQYVRNTITGKYSSPKLKGYFNSNTIDIEPNASLYHFCFIEKSRIDNFARISANTPSEKTNLLSILFGLNEFNEFVNEFTDNIENYIDTKGEKNTELTIKAASIKVHKENITKEKKALEEISTKKREISTEAKLNKFFDELDEYIHGKEDQNGRIKAIEQELAKPTLPVYEIPTIEEIKKNILEIQTCEHDYMKYKTEYSEKKDAVKFKELYELVIGLQPLSSDKCPVCETPIEKTLKHPFENAQIKLNELEYIAELENKIEKEKDDLSEKLDLFKKNIGKRIEVSHNFELEKPLEEISFKQSEFKNEIEAYSKKLIEFYNKNQNDHYTFEQIIKANNANALLDNDSRQRLLKEKNNFDLLSEKIKRIKTLEKAKLENIEKWQKIIDQFIEDNKELIDAAKKEKEQIELNRRYVEAYKNTLEKLNQYKNNLAIKHVSKLNELTVRFYNQINIHDKNFELFSKVNLPSNHNDPIFIYFKDNPDKKYDALQILSEGHIRCLGLSILIAKNVQEGFPIIIFDDIVNAIDDDHRGGIRKLLFEDEHLRSKQIILTTHASQFVKELEQHPSKQDYDKLVKKLVFLPDSLNRKIRVKCDDLQNNISKAIENYEKTNYSEALYFCRCGLENITNRLWTRFGKRHKTEFSVVIRAPKSVPDLMSVASSLNKFIKKNDNNGEYKIAIDIFDYLIGLEKNSNIIWEYLNKGTHEEPGKDEFDQLIVLEIINKITELDNFVKQK